MAKILGIDIGTATIGVAVSDMLEIIAQPQEVIKYAHDNKEEFIKSLKLLIVKYKPLEIVYGLPLNMDGTNSKTTEYVKEGIKLAKKTISLNFVAIDERMTSQAATKAIINAGFKKSLRKEKNHEIAASFILQQYLDSK